MSNKEINGVFIESFFKHLGYLLASGSLMVAGVLVAKFSDKIITSLPLLGIISGVILALSGLGMAVWVVGYGIQEIWKKTGSPLKTLILGILYLTLAVQVVMASFFAATSI